MIKCNDYVNCLMLMDVLNNKMVVLFSFPFCSYIIAI